MHACICTWHNIFLPYLVPRQKSGKNAREGSDDPRIHIMELSEVAIVSSEAVKPPKVDTTDEKSPLLDLDGPDGGMDPHTLYLTVFLGNYRIE